jgi:hypothetical protein
MAPAPTTSERGACGDQLWVGLQGGASVAGLTEVSGPRGGCFVERAAEAALSSLISGGLKGRPLFAFPIPTPGVGRLPPGIALPFFPSPIIRRLSASRCSRCRVLESEPCPRRKRVFNEIDVKEPLQIAALNASIGRILLKNSNFRINHNSSDPWRPR